MKLSFQWGSTTQTKKRVVRQPKIRWELLGMVDPAEEKKSVSIEEIRRRVVLMSDQSLECDMKAAHDGSPSTRPPKRDSNKSSQKSRRTGSA